MQRDNTPRVSCLLLVQARVSRGRRSGSSFVYGAVDTPQVPHSILCAFSSVNSNTTIWCSVSISQNGKLRHSPSI